MNDIIAMILLSILMAIPIIIFAKVAGDALDEIYQSEKEIEKMKNHGNNQE